MACGSAVISTACGGIAEYARDGRNCLIVDAGRPSALAKALRRICQNTVLRAALSAEGITSARRYGREKLTEAFLDRIDLPTAPPQLIDVVK
jgi:glycosyltransferase involved in cell wall biosynthesis